MRLAIRIAAVLLASAALRAGLPAEAPIRITLNPEARVSAAIVGALPTTVRCGATFEVPLKVVNQGFITEILEATLVGEVPAGATVSLSPGALNGSPTETRVLRLCLEHPGTADLTIAFRARNEIPDMGGRDRIHFLVLAQ